MEHIIQFGVTIDDEVIKAHIEDKAVEQIAQSMQDTMRARIYDRYSGDFTETMRGALFQFLEPYKEQIIEKATAQVVDSIKHSKKYKAALAQIAEEMIGE